MARNKYFNTIASKSEQNLVENLIVEAIKIMGTDAFYLPRNDQNTDLIYGEDPLKSFTTSYEIEIYNSDTREFEGQKEMFSKFGIDIHNDYTVLLSRRTFLQQVLSQNPIYDRPKEGDLIYIPHVSRAGTLFEITFVEPDADFFMLGRKLPYYYELKLEPFKYSNELLQTGVSDIDIIMKKDAYNIKMDFIDNTIGGDILGILILGNETNSVDFIIGEYIYQGLNFDTATASAIVNNWNLPENQLQISQIKGQFNTGENVIGVISGAVFQLLSFDPLQNNFTREAFDNRVTTNEADSYIDSSEINPLSDI